MTLLDLLNLETGASIETIERIVATAPRRYKVYQIPKKSGGTRTIAHPAKELKILQRIILKGILDKIPTSDIATAYVKGRGIAYNAKVHAGNKWILKLDFKDFFHSIVPSDWNRVMRRTDELRPFAKEAALFHKLLFWGAGSYAPHCLSIGAPTSPSVSNLVCSRLDKWMAEYAAKLDVSVTRYADDITISGNIVGRILKFEHSLNSALSKNVGLNLALNPDKRGLYGPADRKMVTGVILTPEGKISIGRERKREISALVHKFSLNAIDAETVFRVRGLMAFAFSVEPEFFSSMIRKYGDKTVIKLMRSDPDTYSDFGDIDF